MRSLITKAMNKCFRELKTRNPGVNPERLRPGLVGWDIMQDIKARWYIIEANAGAVGGIQTLEDLYRGDKAREGKALMPLMSYLNEMGDECPAAGTEGVDQRLDISSDPYCLAELGYLFIKNDDAKAVVLLQRAVELNDRLGQAWYCLGIALYNLDRYGESEQALRRAVKLSPGDKDYWFDLADLYYTLKRYEEAARALRRSLSVDPVYLEAKKLLGKVNSILAKRNRRYEAKPSAHRTDIDGRILFAIASAA